MRILFIFSLSSYLYDYNNKPIIKMNILLFIVSIYIFNTKDIGLYFQYLKFHLENCH